MGFWRLTLVCSLHILLWSLFFSAIVPMMPYYADAFEISLLGQGTLLAVLQLGFVLGVLCSSVCEGAGVSTASQVKVAALISATGAGLMTLQHLPPLWLFMLSRTLEGFGSAVLSVNLDSLLAQKMPGRLLGRALGIRTALGSLGHLYGPLVGGLLFNARSVQLPMALIAGVAICAFVAYSVMLPSDCTVKRDDMPHPGPMHQALAAMRQPQFATLLAYAFLVWTLIGLVFMTVPRELATVYMLTPQQLTLAWFVLYATMIPMSMLSGCLADCLRPGLCMPILLLLQGSACGALGLVKGLRGFLCVTCALFMIGTAGSGLLGPHFQKLLGLCANEAGPQISKAMYSVYGLVVSLSLVVGSILPALLFEHGVSFQRIHVVTGVALLACYSLIIVFGSRGRPHA